MKRRFLLGNPPPDAVSQNLILKENLKYGDLIQGDFDDNYGNLSLKHLLGLRYGFEHCSNYRFISLKASFSKQKIVFNAFFHP